MVDPTLLLKRTRELLDNVRGASLISLNYKLKYDVTSLQEFDIDYRIFSKNFHTGFICGLMDNSEEILTRMLSFELQNIESGNFQNETN